MGLFNRKDKDGAESADATSSASSAAPPTIETAAPPLTSAALENQPADKAPGPGPGEEDENQEYPTGLRLALLLISVMLTLFLVSLDRLIISTAIPQITNDFHSVTDIGWYGSAYLLTNSAFQLLFGRLYTIFSVKVVFLTAIFLFEAGSALCGAAPNSVAFIIGRAIAGLGGAGLISGVITTIVYAVPLHKRPLYQGLFGAVFGVSSVIGPLLGGAFTSKVTWRWCFYINLPFGGVAMVFIALLLKVPDRASTKLPLKEKILQLDLPGTACVLPGVICLLLALQWGGSTYPWSDGRIIALLVLAGVLLIGFVLVQVYLPKTATLPPRIFKQRSIIAGVWATICIGAQMMVFVYFLPIWFQAIQGVSAIDSGIRTLPMVLPMVLASIITGALVSRIGYYTPFMIIGNCIMAVGAGLLTTLQVDSSEGIWFGYQVLYGFGMGCTFQAPNMAAQTVLARDDVPIGSALMFFTQLLGGAVFISVAQNVLNSELLKRLSPLPGFNPKLLESNGATSLITQLPEAIRGTAVFEYNEALRKVFLVGLIMVCLALIGSVTMEWKSVKKDKKKDTKGGMWRRGEKAYLDEKERDVGGGAVEEKEKEINA
ncbi:major facilitator superfamily domain-containing protein [Bombardia bombarda]|uniref:Major facilitator superfamily domain-containing protein n=1 Tax=Bombardia bombarda TaxID=252184 RepID=A0AA39XKT2_9PEZI|nr:major facilitator superfamily domain-containing protein [Bombardia bombarda]